MGTRLLRHAANIIPAFVFLTFAASFPVRAANPYTCQHSASAKFLDGRLDDWKSEPSIGIDGWYWRPAEGSKPIYGGINDLWGSLRMAWDTKNLYIALTVIDDVFLPPKTEPLDTGDAVFFTIAPAQHVFGGNAAAHQLLFTMNGNTTIYQQDEAGTWLKIPEAKIGAARGILPIPTTPIKCESGKTPPTRISKIIYELAIPWALLPEITPKARETFGVALTIQDTDGAGLRGALKWRGIRETAQTATGYAQVLFAKDK